MKTILLFKKYGSTFLIPLCSPFAFIGTEHNMGIDACFDCKYKLHNCYYHCSLAIVLDSAERYGVVHPVLHVCAALAG